MALAGVTSLFVGVLLAFLLEAIEKLRRGPDARPARIAGKEPARDLAPDSASPADAPVEEPPKAATRRRRAKKVQAVGFN
jgi:hypothetical protein